MSKVSTFLGYHRVSSAGMIAVLTRPEVTVPATRVSKGNPAVVLLEDVVSTLVELVTENELIPVGEDGVSADLGTSIAAVLDTIQTSAEDNSTTIAVKFGLKISTFGSNLGKGVFTITCKGLGIKSEILIAAESEGE